MNESRVRHRSVNVRVSCPPCRYTFDDLGSDGEIHAIVPIADHIKVTGAQTQTKAHTQKHTDLSTVACTSYPCDLSLLRPCINQAKDMAIEIHSSRLKVAIKSENTPIMVRCDRWFQAPTHVCGCKPFVN